MEHEPVIINIKGLQYDRQVIAATVEETNRAVDNMSVSSLRSFEYLEGLPGTTFNRLYKQPSTALAIFRRMLPHLGMPWLLLRIHGQC